MAFSCFNIEFNDAAGEIDSSLVRYTYAHMSGIVPCMIVAFAVVGCAFRYHADESPLPWAFAGCVVLWGMSHPALVEYMEWTIEEYLIRLKLDLSQYRDYIWDAHERWTRVGAGLMTAVYAWLFCWRNGSNSFRRLAIVLLGSGLLSFSISWLTGTVGFNGHTQGTLPGITFDQYREFFMRDGPFDRLSVERLPSWGEGIGWIIWYIGLFGGKPQTLSATNSA